MAQRLVFVNRRRGTDRRFEDDPRQNKGSGRSIRRKAVERRDLSRSLTDDYYVYMKQAFEKQASANSDSSE